MGLLSKCRKWWDGLDESEVTRAMEAPKKAPKKRAPRRDFNEMYPGNALVEMMVTENPKRRGTEARVLYDKYEFCHTVCDCLEVGMTYRMIDGDVKRGYIEVVMP